MWEKDVHHLHSFYIMSTWNWRSRAFKARVQRASLWTPQVPTNLVALKMDLDFVFNLIFESLKDIRSRKIRTDVKIQKRKLPSWEFYGGRVPSWLLKRLLWRVMYWKYIILCPSNNNLFLWVVVFGNLVPQLLQKRSDSIPFSPFDLLFNIDCWVPKSDLSIVNSLHTL